jgi:D-alanine-D-alanine ligase-like ATP-grasp enzyme
MVEFLRVGLRTTTIVTIGATAWLGWVLFTVVPARDPGSEAVWAAIAAGALAVSLAALLATTRRQWPGPALGVVLAILSAAALAIGFVVLASQATTGNGGHGEGYLLALGVIFTVQGLFGLAWLGIVAMARR